MFAINWVDPLWGLAARFAVNAFAMALLMFGMYYRRYRDKELATTGSMFNIFVFSVLTILSSVAFRIAAGFGSSAILALFRAWNRLGAGFNFRSIRRLGLGSFWPHAIRS